MKYRLGRNLPGLSASARVLMAENGKFKDIGKLRVGDAVASYNTLTSLCEVSKVVNVEYLSFDLPVRFIHIVDNMGTEVEVTRRTRMLTRVPNTLLPRWILAEQIQDRFHIYPISGYYRNSSLVSSARIVLTERRSRPVGFYIVECYPNNNFFVNCNRVRILHLLTDYLASVWGILVRGYPGQIGTLLPN